MQKDINIGLVLSRVGLGLIFCYCLTVSILFVYFAQLHLTLPFLPFPIFVGEVLMFICLFLLAGVCEYSQVFDRRSLFLLSLYFGWVLIKALINYHYDGPLTCRNAALFYYPIFAVFAYCFYQKAKIPRKVLMPLALLAAGIMFFKGMVVWYWWTYVTLFVIAVCNTKSAKLRWLGWTFLMVVFLLGKEYFYKGPRAHFVSVFGAVIFLISYFGAILAQRRDYVRLNILLFSFIFFLMGFFIFSDKKAITSITSLKGMINTYNEFDKQYQDQQANFVPKKIPIQLYNPKKFKTFFLAPTGPISQARVSQAGVSQAGATQARVSQAGVSQAGATQARVSQAGASQAGVTPARVSQAGASQAGATQARVSQAGVSQEREHQSRVSCPAKPQQSILNNILRCRIRDERSFDLDENNIVFRFFVWRDMAHDLIQERAWWGFSFGKPQRSKSLEVLHWGDTEWGRDGWITPHNSFFHIIYRAGILGLGLIGVLFYMMGKLIKDFFRMNSPEGGFLVAGLIYWIVLSNFFVILEFPYNAIIFWTLFGITCAYRDDLKVKAIK